VDEVLAVGDTQFQKKCLGKMGDVAKGGRTVLFVSHNMAAITQLCSNAVLLEHGTVKEIDSANKVVRRYLTTGSKKLHTVDLTHYKPRRGTQDIVFEWAQLRDSKQKACQEFSIGDDITVTLGIKPVRHYHNKKVKVAVQLRTSDGIQICNMVDVDSRFQIEHLRDREVLSVYIKDIRLYPDTYYASLWVGNITSTEVFDHVQDCLSFEIIDGGKLTARRLPRSAGLLFLTPEWKREDHAGPPI
jgi:lipopolysaccharide transport system ATP-binding protein